MNLATQRAIAAKYTDYTTDKLKSTISDAKLSWSLDAEQKSNIAYEELKTRLSQCQLDKFSTVFC